MSRNRPSPSQPTTKSACGGAIARVLRNRRKLVDAFLSTVPEGMLVGDREVSAMVNETRQILGKALRPEVLRWSLEVLEGVRSSRESLEKLAWRLAGNFRRLRAGRPVYPWRGQKRAETVPFQVRAVRFLPDKPDRVLLDLQILSGSPAGMLTTVSWSRRFSGYLAPVAGFGKPSRRRQPSPGVTRPIASPLEWVSLRMTGKLKISTEKGDKLAFDEFDCTPQCRAWNRQVIAGRQRLFEQCPRGFEHACHTCPVGYSECPLGTHARTYVQRTCAACKRDDAYFDGDAKTCVDCQRRGLEDE